MILSLLFALGLVASLWLYFIRLDIMNFKKNQNDLETPLPGRPARRTIGRINDDIAKGIMTIFAGYIVFALMLYGALNFADLLPINTLAMLACLGMGAAVFIMSPSNRQLHAYAALGHIAVIHLVTSLAAFIGFVAVFYKDYLKMEEMGALTFMVIGAMLVFSRKMRDNRTKREGR